MFMLCVNAIVSRVWMTGGDEGYTVNSQRFCEQNEDIIYFIFSSSFFFKSENRIIFVCSQFRRKFEMKMEILHKHV